MTTWLPHADDAPVALGAAGTRTLRDLRRDARALAATLLDGASELLVTHVDRYDVAVALLAAWSRGLAVALPPNLQPETLTLLLSSPSVRRGTPRAAEEAEGEGSDPAPTRHVVTLHTSGSTGVPKRIEKTAAQLLGEARVHAALLGLRAGDVVMATVPALHIYGLLFGVLVPLVAGGAMVRETTFDPLEIAALAARFGARVLVSVPAHLGVLATRVPTGLAARVVSSGAPLAPETWRALAAAGLSVCEVYGTTETGGIGARDAASAPFAPLPGVRVRVADDGRLELASPFAEGADVWTRGDDRVALDGAGFRLLGRADDVVKVGSKRVSLSEVVSLLRALPGVRDAAAVVRPATSARGQRIAAVVVAPSWTSVTLRAALATRLDPAVVPRRIERVTEIPREANGKLRSDRIDALLAHPAAPEPPAPKVALVHRGGGVVHAHVPAGEAAFDGHFDGDPVFPGAALLHDVVLPAARQEWPGLGRLVRVPRVKLRRPIRPDDDLVLRLSREAHTVTFVATLREAPCASGTLVFDEGSA